MSNGIRDLAALAADDAKVECFLTIAKRAELAEYADEWDAMVEEAEEQGNRRALAFPSWFLPVSVGLLVVIVLAWR